MANSFLVRGFNQVSLSMGIKSPVQEKSYRDRFFSYYTRFAKANPTSHKALNCAARVAFVVLTIVVAIFISLGAIAVDGIKALSIYGIKAISTYGIKGLFNAISEYGIEGSFQAISNLKNKIIKKPESKLDKLGNFVKNHKLALSVGSIALIAAGIYFRGSSEMFQIPPAGDVRAEEPTSPNDLEHMFKRTLEDNLESTNSSFNIPSVVQEGFLGVMMSALFLYPFER